MASSKSFVLALAVFLFGVPILASTAHAEPAANKSAAQQEKTANRNANLVKVMQKHGFSETKAKIVVAAITRYEKDFRRVHKDMAQAGAALRDDKPNNDKAAHARIDADKKQLESLKQRYQADISKALTASERNKLAQILAPPKPKDKGKGKGHEKAKHKQPQKRR
jgi:hypothetical protein